MSNKREEQKKRLQSLNVTEVKEEMGLRFLMQKLDVHTLSETRCREMVRCL